MRLFSTSKHGPCRYPALSDLGGWRKRFRIYMPEVVGCLFTSSTTDRYRSSEAEVRHKRNPKGASEAGSRDERTSCEQQAHLIVMKLTSSKRRDGVRIATLLWAMRNSSIPLRDARQWLTFQHFTGR